MQRGPYVGFEAVDRMPAPQRYVATMDAVHADAQVVADKRWWMDLLEVQPGQRVLDLGCGTGADGRLLAQQAGPGGAVIGVDASMTMLTAARTRAMQAGALQLSLAGDAHNLPLRDAAVDACWSDRVLQHLRDPRRVLAEVARVTRPGGRIVIGGPDFGTQVIDADDRATTRAVLDFRCDRLRLQGWVGRQLPRLFADAGLVDIVVYPTTVAVWGTPTPGLLAELDAIARSAEAAGVISAAARVAWTTALQERADAGRWFSSHTSFTVAGRSPNR